VVSTCINTIGEFYSYRWQNEDTGTIQRLHAAKDAPVDQDNHALAAVRYVMNYLAGEMDIRSVLLPNALLDKDEGMGPVQVRGGYRIPDVSWDNNYGREGFGKEHFG
jgi:hypothetical protein